MQNIYVLYAFISIVIEKKRDGTVPTYWFIFEPFTNLPFGICAICFDPKV